jgi:hypothetical protein
LQQDVQQGEVFLKFFVGARNGLMAHLGSDLWHVYCALATYMDKDGVCYPTQKRLAKDLGIRREAVNRRVKKLLEVEWKGEKLVTVEKHRDTRTQAYANTVYKLNTNLAFRIF